MNREREDVFKAIELIKERKVDITADYIQWVKLGYCLIEILGIEAREIFHEFSKFHSKYSFADCERQFNKLERTYEKGKTNKSFLFWLLKQNHIIIYEK